MRRAAAEPADSRAVAQALLIEMARRIEAERQTAGSPDLNSLAQLEPILLSSLGLPAVEPGRPPFAQTGGRLQAGHVNGRAAGKATRLAEAGRSAQQAPGRKTLALRNLTFCTRIECFGRYWPLPPGPLRPGQVVLLYCEVVNFTSRPHRTANSRLAYLTRLHVSVVIEQESGKLAQRLSFPPVIDRCFCRRSDFFLSFRFAIPAQLPPGRYRLVVLVRDELGGTEAAASVPFKLQRPRPAPARAPDGKRDSSA